MKYKLILILFLFSIYSFSQDTIVRTNGKKILAKVLSIKGNKIEYKNYHYQQGPTITIYKVKVWKIIFPNGVEEIISEPDYFSNIKNPTKKSTEDNKSKWSRKGVYLGLSFKPGFGSIFLKEEDLANGYSIKERQKKYSHSYGFDINVAFSNNFAFKSGVFSSTYIFYEKILSSRTYYQEIENEYEYHFQEISIPLNLSLSFGAKNSINIDAGITLNLPRRSYIIDDKTDFAMRTNSQSKELVISENINVYLTIPFSKDIIFGIGGFQTYGLFSYSDIDEKRNIMYGLYLSLNIRLTS